MTDNFYVATELIVHSGFLAEVMPSAYFHFTGHVIIW